MTVDLAARTYPVPVSVLRSLPDQRSRERLLALARAQEDAARVRWEDANRRAAERARDLRENWRDDPWVRDVLLAAALQRAQDEAAGHQPGYWSAPCVECDRTKPTAVHQCRSCGRYNTRRGQP